MTNESTPIWRLAALLAAVVLALAACGGATDTTEDGSDTTEAGSSDTEPTEGTDGGDGGEDLTIAMVPKALSIPYFDVSSAGAVRAAEELGITLDVVGPSEPNAEAQIPFIETAIEQGVDAITIAANDPNALTPTLRRAEERGIAVTTFDSDVAEGRAFFVNQVDSDEFALAMLNSLGEQIGYEGQIAILSGLATAPNQIGWIAVMEEALATDEWADVELVEIAYGDSVDQKCADEFNGLLQAYPDLAGVVVPDAVCMPAASRVLSTADRDLALAGGALPNDMKTYINDGVVKEFILWDVDALGYLTVYATHALVTGEIAGEPGDSFTAGDLGEYEVRDDGTILLGPPFTFDASNVNDFDF